MENRGKSELRKLIQEQYVNIAGMVVLKDDQIVYEDYFDGYNQSQTLHVASVTKSVFSVLIGIAVDKGAIKTVEQRVLDFFPEYKIRRGEKTIQDVRIKNLLTMTAPYKFKNEPYTRVYSRDDWTEAVLDLLGGQGKIGEFKYTTLGMQVLSGILTKATGQSVLDFARENLFEPLGIQAPHNRRIQNKEEYLAFLKDKHVSGWVVDPRGVNTAGWGLALSARNMGKIGQIYLNKGRFQDRQIVSSQWIEESTRAHSHWGDRAYGYLWWIIEDQEFSGTAALGDGGNVIYVSPEKKMVIAIASRFMPRPKDRMELIRKHIAPLF